MSKNDADRSSGNEQTMLKMGRMVFAVVAVGYASGCALFGGGESQPLMQVPPKAPAAVESASVQPSVVLTAAEQPAPVVNVFGEFDNVERPVTRGGLETGFQQHTVTDEGDDADVSSDPTGKWLVFSSTRHSEKADIYLQRVDGASVIQLTTDPADDAHPVFSSDGTRIAFASSRSGNWDIYVMDLDGKNIQQVTSSPAQEMHPSFSPDGSRLVCSALSPRSENWELWTIDLTTNQRKMIGHGLFPVWSPEKGLDRIAFQRARQRGSRWFSLWTLDLVEGEPRRLTEVAVSSNAAVLSPSWSPDGKRLAFTTLQLNAAPGKGGQDVWVIGADGTGRQRLTEGLGTNLAPFWSNDNRIYFVSDRGGRENIWSVRADGSGATATADAAAHDASAHDDPAHAPAAHVDEKQAATDTQEVAK